MQIRTTKFPYFFWGLNKSYKCDLDFSQGIYKNLDVGTQYKFKKLNSFSFLALKYSPILFVFYFTFNRFDFTMNNLTILAYLFALILASAINLFDNLVRQVLSISIILVAVIVGFFIDEIFLVAYVLKYFLLFSVLIMIFVDSRLQAYSILNSNGKVVSNFTILKEKKDEKN